MNRLTNRKERAIEYEKVIIETSKSIYRYLLKIGVTPAEAEDIVQDTIQKSYINLNRITSSYT
ncbi:hypothetical protein FOS05_13745 [Bacillus mycoides]|nr:hypothetical protein [Bacillus mycoides]